MNNTILPFPPTLPSNPIVDKVVTGLIENLPAPLLNLQSGDNLLLQALMNSDSSTLKAFVTLNLANRTTEIPLSLKLDTPLQLPADRTLEIAVKIMAQNNGTAAVRLESINNEKPTVFIRQENATSTAVKLPAAETAVIKDTSTMQRRINILPLKLAPVIEQIATDLKIPPQLTAKIVQNFSSPQVNVSIEKVVLPPIQNTASAQPQPQITVPQFQSAQPPQLMLSQLPALEPFSSAVKELVSNFMNQGQQPAALPQLIQDIKSSLPLLENVTFPAKAEVSGEQPLLVLKSILGDIFPETPLKLDKGADVLLKLGTILNSNQSAGAGHSIRSTGFLEQILAPLQHSADAPLAAQVMDKLPAVNAKMLSNMVSFMKGSTSRQLSDWLGKELVSELKSQGAEGREIVSRLSDFMTANSREGVSWRMVEIPLLHEGVLGKIKVAVKKNSDEEEDEKNSEKKQKRGTRFVVDTTFTRLGEFQFDGFSTAAERRFDLIIRTSREVSDDIYSAILRIFKTSLYEVDYVGNININVKENFIKICEDEDMVSRLDGVFI